jgi:hypothetical protein
MIKMVSIIHADSGITLFSRVFDKFCELVEDKQRSDLIGSFIGAIKKFSQEFSQDEIRLIEMSNLKFLCSERDNILIFFILEGNDNVQEYEKSLKMSLRIFLMLFSQQINDNYNNISIFQRFNIILQDILKIPPEKIEPSCLNCPMGQKNNCIFNQIKEKVLDMNDL